MTNFKTNDMTQLEHKITSAFTIGHARQTLSIIIEAANEVINKNQCTEGEKRKLDGITRYLHNAINQIDEATTYFKN